MKAATYPLTELLPLSHTSRYVRSAVSLGHHCVAGRWAVGGATISPVLLPPGHIRTGSRDTLCAHDTHRQVHTLYKTNMVLLIDWTNYLQDIDY